MEKIHGTSCHIGYNIVKDQLIIFSGGIKHSDFVSMLEYRFESLSVILDRFRKSVAENLCEKKKIIVYGEGYGGKCQRMAHAYGALNFIAFEVKIDEDWLTVPDAEVWAKRLGFDFVHYEVGPATIEWINEQRDAPSIQAIRNGLGGDKIREGIVIRTINDDKDRFGNRIIAKHKHQKFCETKTPREVNPEKRKVWGKAREVAEEYVTENRLEHVIDKLKSQNIVMCVQNTGEVIKEMTQDVRLESYADFNDPEVKWTKEVGRAIGRQTAIMFKQWLNKNLED